MSRKVRFSGAESYFIIGMLMFWVLGALGAVGVTLLFATGQADPSAENVITFVVCLAAFALFSRAIWRDLHLIKEIEITDDNTWVLRSLFGVERARLAEGEPRKFSAFEGSRWILTGVARKIRISYAEIESGDRKWTTTQSPPSDQRDSINTMLGWIREHGGQ